MELNNLFVWIGIVVTFVGLVFVFVILGTLIGLFTGWVIHISPLRWWVEQGFLVVGFNVSGKLPHIGAMLGFIGGFFSSHLYSESKKKNQ
jgi:hypothetical protein